MSEQFPLAALQPPSPRPLSLYPHGYIVAAGGEMLRRAFLALTLLCWSGAALAADIVDATGRTVQVPDQVAHVLPAGPPAAVLLAALAPDLMLGWPFPIPPESRAYLAPEAASLPLVPRVTGPRRRHRQGHRPEARPDRGLRHGLAAL